MFVLRHIEPELAHKLALYGLKTLSPFWRRPSTPAGLEVKLLGMTFAHPVGVAAGLDKNGTFIDALGKLGCSHIEVGTITPVAQSGNPRPRLFRVTEMRAIVNRMGFNNEGAEYALHKLAQSHYQGVKGVSIGKNAATPLDRAGEDYRACLRKLYSVADYFAINVSSPNTANLRELQSNQRLEEVVAGLQEERLKLSRVHGKVAPLLLKVAPDLSTDAITILARDLRRLAVDGVIATNTTTEIANVSETLAGYQGGGLSGSPLHKRSVEVIRQFRAELGGSFPIIGVGGIDTGEAALETLSAGANLIQLYTGLVYRGPRLISEILEAIAKMRQSERPAAINAQQSVLPDRRDDAAPG